MPLELAHIVDELTPEDASRQLSLLLRRRPGGRLKHHVVAVGSCPGGLIVPPEVTVSRVSRRGMLNVGRPRELRRVLAEVHPEILHAWGTSAAEAARLVRPPGTRIVTTLTDPSESDDLRRWWPLDADHGSECRLSVVCTSELTRTRMVGAGIPREATTVIRPGVDRGEFERARPSANRAALGLPEKGPVLVTPSPATRMGGQFFAAWATAILFQIWPEVRLLIPGRSREQERIRRLIDTIYCPQAYLLTEDRYSPAELLAMSDLLVAPSIQDGPCGWMAAAMLAGVPVVASDLPSNRELLRDGETGFLCRPGEPHTLAIRIRTALESPQVVARCTSAARRQAADWFDPDGCIRSYEAVYTAVAGALAQAGSPG